MFNEKAPTRPLRVKPVGSRENDTDAFKKFRKVAYEKDFPIRFIERNPKKVGSKSYDRWRKYSQATTLRQIVELSATSRIPG